MNNHPSGHHGTSRIIQLSSIVDDSTVAPIVQSILTWNQEDAEKAKSVVGFVPKPIELYISSYGGYIYCGLTLINAINTSKTPVHGYCIGYAMSMAFIILISCHKRFGYKHSTYMYHQLSTAFGGKYADMKENLQVMTGLQKTLDDIVFARTKIDRKKIKEVNDKKFDWYMTTDEAKKLNVIDEIIV